MTAASMLIRATFILAFALIGARVAHKSRASVRHVLLAASFAGLMLLPLASLIAPSIRVPVSPSVQHAIEPLSVDLSRSADAPAPVTIAAHDSPGNAAPAMSSASAILASAWMLGVVIFLGPCATGLWQVRTIRRSALPWLEGRAMVQAAARDAGVHRAVDLLLHEALPGPMTCGIVLPAIILPADAATWTAADLRRAVVHEMEHIRRGDWISQCITRVIAAFYWFHPFVWTAWRKLSLEAERACDDAVLRASEATAYADQLIVLAKRLSTNSHPQLAMADRRDLSARVMAVLDVSQRRGRAGAAWIGAAVIAMVALPVGISSIRIVAAQGTSAAPQAPRQKYDAATVKPCEAEENPTGARGTAGGTNASFSPGHFFVPCVTTGQLIYLAYAAYGVPNDQHLINDDSGEAANDTKVRGGPSWVHSLRDKYSIEATAAGETDRYVLMGTMLQSLLEERFHLKIHRGTEDVDMLAMTVAKSGFKLKPMKDGDCVAYTDGMTMADMAAKPVCGNLNMSGDNGATVWKFGSGTIGGLAGQLARALKIHILDKTNITDKFVFEFRFVRDPDLFEMESNVSRALEEQLGLKLEKAKGPRGFLVIDSITRPSSDGRSGFTRPARAAGPGFGR